MRNSVSSSSGQTRVERGRFALRVLVWTLRVLVWAGRAQLSGAALSFLLSAVVSPFLQISPGLPAQASKELGQTQKKSGCRQGKKN